MTSSCCVSRAALERAASGKPAATTYTHYIVHGHVHVRGRVHVHVHVHVHVRARVRACACACACARARARVRVRVRVHASACARQAMRNHLRRRLDGQRRGAGDLQRIAAKKRVMIERAAEERLC